jgi:transposase
VVEAGRPKRPARRTGAKSDALDAVRAARQALIEDYPNQLKALIVGAPEELRAELRRLASRQQIARCAASR